jgi:hypothetical protein
LPALRFGDLAAPWQEAVAQILLNIGWISVLKLQGLEALKGSGLMLTFSQDVNPAIAARIMTATRLCLSSLIFGFIFILIVN